MINGIPIRTVTLEVTHHCHRRCSFCYVPHPTKPADGPTALPVDVLAERVSQLLAETGCSRVQLSGGEPLLYADLLELIDLLEPAGAQVSIITDAGPLEATLARSLAARRVGPLQPTLLAGSAALHDRLRGPGAFVETTRAIAVARAAGLPVVVSFVITRENWAEAAGVAELAFALGVDRFTLSRFCPAGAAAKAHATLTPDATQVFAAARAAVPMCRALGMKLSAAITIPACVWPDPDRPPLPVGVCSLMGSSTTVTIGPDGAVKSCALSSRPVGVLGDVPWPELARRLWEGELKPCRETRPILCRDCRWYSRCLGGCRLAGLGAGGTLEAVDPVAPGPPGATAPPRAGG